MNPARRPWILASALFLATLAVYAPTLGSAFVQFDDPGYVTDNPHVVSGLTRQNVAWAFTTFDQGNWHPLTWLSHMTDVELYGLHPAGHHATSILLHALNVAFLFLLLDAATGRPWRSLVVAALFALHPINVETVAWISERKSLLCMFFSLVTIGLYGRYARAPHGRRYGAVVFCFALALMSKPMAVTLPVVLLLLDVWPLERMRFAAPSTPLRALVIEKLPLFLMSAASSWVTIVAQKRGEAVTDLVRLPLSLRFANAALSYAAYLRKLVWPADLAYFYPHRGLNLSTTDAALAAVLLLAITVAISLLVIYRHERRYLLVGWLFFGVTLLPVIGVLQVGLQSMADRYAYLPFLGIFVAIVWGLADVAQFRPRIVTSVAALVLVALSACTLRTESYWHSSLALFTRAHEVTRPPNLFIETNLAAALLDDHRDAEALEHFRLAAQIAPNVFVTHYNIGYLLSRRGDFAGAVREFQRALACPTDPSNQARALNSLGLAYLNLSQRREALDAFTRLLALEPGNKALAARIDELRK